MQVHFIAVGGRLQDLDADQMKQGFNRKDVQAFNEKKALEQWLASKMRTAFDELWKF